MPKPSAVPPSAPVADVLLPEPLATVTAQQLADAITAGRWAHETQALWLNSAFPPMGREAAELAADLEAHGVEVR